MTIARIEGAPATARWTTRLALFALVLVVTSIAMHRFFGLATPVFLSLLVLSFALAAVAVGLGIISAVDIWKRGGPGTSRLVAGFLVGLGILAWPLSAGFQSRSLPELNDVTTSPRSPPPFDVLAAKRTGTANGPRYPAEKFAEKQATAFPDLATMEINRPVGEIYDLVLEAVRREGMAIVKDQPPAEENGMVGVIEAQDRTLILGFYDDVAVRVTAGGEGALVDFRSASRYGRHDLGRNVERVRTMMRGVVARLESTLPGAVASARPVKGGKAETRAERRRERSNADRKREGRRQQ